jgi:hypothetical protein
VAPSDGENASFADRLTDLVKSETGITPELEMIETSALEKDGPAWKAKLFEDLRKRR